MADQIPGQGTTDIECPDGFRVAKTGEADTPKSWTTAMIDGKLTGARWNLDRIAAEERLLPRIHLDEESYAFKDEEECVVTWLLHTRNAAVLADAPTEELLHVVQRIAAELQRRMA